MVMLAVDACHFQGIGRDISGIQIGKSWLVNSQSNWDCATAGAYISYNGSLSSIEHILNDFAGGIDQEFGLWSGNQDTAIHEKIQAVELFMADQVGYRLSFFSRRRRHTRLLLLFRGEHTFRMGIEG